MEQFLIAWLLVAQPKLTATEPASGHASAFLPLKRFEAIEDCQEASLKQYQAVAKERLKGTKYQEIGGMPRADYYCMPIPAEGSLYDPSK